MDVDYTHTCPVSGLPCALPPHVVCYWHHPPFLGHSNQWGLTNLGLILPIGEPK